jgi:hypothetical protein
VTTHDKAVSRVFSIDPPLQEGVDRTYYRPVRFVVEGTPSVESFYVDAAAWERLNRPARIRVTVEAEPNAR